MSKSKLILIAAIVLLAGVLIYLSPAQYLNLAYIQSQLQALLAYQAANPIMAAAVYCAIYILVTAASIPGALILTLLGGAIFGFIIGSVLVLISATIGATIAFLLARYLCEDWVVRHMGERLAKIRASCRKEGALYLFSMRLVPVIPFFAINLLMGLTSIKVTTYFIASFLGMAPGTMVFVNAGTQLAKLDSLKGLLSPALLLSFLLLAVFPYVAKFLLNFIRNRSNKNDC